MNTLKSSYPGSLRNRLRPKRPRGNQERATRKLTRLVLKYPQNQSAADPFGQSATGGVTGNEYNPIEYWIQKQTWPKECFEQDDRIKKDFWEDSWFEKYHIGKHEEGIRRVGTNLCRTLIETEEVVPNDSSFK
jgi:hypothetical protein